MRSKRFAPAMLKNGCKLVAALFNSRVARPQLFEWWEDEVQTPPEINYYKRDQ